MKDSAAKKKSYPTKEDAIRYAYRLLSYRSRSEKELGERLRRKDFSEEIILNAIKHLKEKGFINDTELALSLKRSAQEIKLLGFEGVRGFLRQRGINKKMIDDVITESDPDEIVRAKKLIDRKLRTMENYSDEEQKKKIYRFLIRKGYSFNTVKQMLKEIGIKEEEG